MKRIRVHLATLLLLQPFLGSLYSQDAGALTNGNWSNPSIWTTGLVPNAANNVYIGSNYLAGAASTATVTLTQNQSAYDVYLGYGAGTNGQLALGNFVLSAHSLTIGNGGTANITRGTGSFQVANLSILNSNSLTTTVNDIVTGNIGISSGSTLTLGGVLTVGDTIDLQGSGTNLNAQGFNINAAALYLGWHGAGATLANRGNLTLGTLAVHNQPITLTPSDFVTQLLLSNTSTTLNPGVTISRLETYNSTTTNTTVGNITGSILLRSNSTLSLATGLQLSSDIEVASGSLVTLGGHITGAGAILLHDAGSTLNAQGFNITANELYLGWHGTGATLTNRGNLTLGALAVHDQPLTLTPSDSVTQFHLSNSSTTLNPGVTVSRLAMYNNSTAATTTFGNITGSIYLTGNSTLALAAGVQLTSNIEIWSGSQMTLGGHIAGAGTIELKDSGSTLNAQGNNIAATALYLAWYGAGGSIVNDGAFNFGIWAQGNSNLTSLHNGNDSITILQLAGGSQLHITDAAGQSTGLTILGLTASSLNIDVTSKLILDIDGLTSDWILRWANPSGGDHVADLNSLIAQELIEFNNPGNSPYQIYSSVDGYTYIANAAVPEPTTILLTAAAGLSALGYYRFRKAAVRKENDADLVIH